MPYSMEAVATEPNKKYFKLPSAPVFVKLHPAKAYELKESSSMEIITMIKFMLMTSK